MNGFVTQIIGPVVDVEFPEGELPGIYNAINVIKEGSGEIIVAEVQYLIGENKARAICMTSTDGVKRGDVVKDTGSSIKVPVGKKTLGRIYQNGHGVKRDYKKAFKWNSKAAEQGDEFAQFRVAWAYANGQGVKKDDKKAVKWYTKSAEQDNDVAQNNLGYMYEHGRGVKKDYKKAV
jgi:TPR repeat protein